MENYTIAGKDYPVLEIVNVQGHPVPLLNIRMMSDERERELGQKGAEV